MRIVEKLINLVIKGIIEIGTFIWKAGIFIWWVAKMLLSPPGSGC